MNRDMLMRNVLVLVVITCLLAVFLSGTAWTRDATDTKILAYSTYVGGSSGDGIRDVAADSEGNVYITGGTESPDFPITMGVYQESHNPSRSLFSDLRRKFFSRITPSDVFVAKLDGKGKIIWSTFIGGPNHDRAYAVEVDKDGYVYVAGRAGEGFPVTPGAFQTTFMGGEGAAFYGPQDGFVCKLTPDGRDLIFCSYFGTSDHSIIRDLALDQNGDIFITGGYKSGIYPEAVSKAFHNAPLGGTDTIVAKIKSDGSRVLWARYLGGSADDYDTSSIRIGKGGYPYVLLGGVTSTDLPTSLGAYDRTYNGGGDFYLAKLTADGTRLVYGTYLGGSAVENSETHGLALDGDDNAYVAALTMSPDFPTTADSYQKIYGGSGGSGTGKNTNYSGDAIVAKISTDGSRLLASTFIGGRSGESAEGVAVDGNGSVYITGATFSDNFPLTSNAFQHNKNGKANCFVVQLSADFKRIVYSTYLGGSKADAGRTATVGTDGSFYVGGVAKSKDFPTRNAQQPMFSGDSDGILVKFVLGTKAVKE